MGKRIAVISALAAALVCALAPPAAAHVTVDPPAAEQGSTARISFLVPNEEPAARVNEVQIAFPTPPQTPIPSVTVAEKPGWTITVTRERLPQPIQTDDGTVNQVVSRISWKAKTPADAIAPTQFGEFTIDADGLPEDEGQVVFRAIQIYSDGTTVRWIDPVTTNGPEAEHPTPILELTPARGGESAITTPTTEAPTPTNRTTIIKASTQDDNARALAIIALALGAVALILATGALLRRRRS